MIYTPNASRTRKVWQMELEPVTSYNLGHFIWQIFSRWSLGPFSAIPDLTVATHSQCFSIRISWLASWEYVMELIIQYLSCFHELILLFMHDLLLADYIKLLLKLLFYLIRNKIVHCHCHQFSYGAPFDEASTLSFIPLYFNINKRVFVNLFLCSKEHVLYEMICTEQNLHIDILNKTNAYNNIWIFFLAGSSYKNRNIRTWRICVPEFVFIKWLLCFIQ